MDNTNISIQLGRRIILPLVVTTLFVLFASCAESDEVIRLKLDVVLKDDLEAILEDVDKDALLDTPYFDLLSYRIYDEGAYSRMAIADFYFLKPIDGRAAKITRKFRYHRRLGLWDRYYNKYYIVPVDENEK